MEIVNIPAKYLAAILVESTPLPFGLFWYQHAGATTFPMYGASGGITASWMAILIERGPWDDYDFGVDTLVDDARGKWYAIKFGSYDTADVIKGKIDKAIKALTDGN